MSKYNSKKHIVGMVFLGIFAGLLIVYQAYAGDPSATPDINPGSRYSFSGATLPINPTITSTGISGNMESRVLNTVAPRYMGWNLAVKIFARRDVSAITNIAYTTTSGTVLDLPVRYSPNASDMAMGLYYPLKNRPQYALGFEYTGNDAIVVNDIIDTQLEKDYLMTDLLTNGGQSASAEFDALINKINNFVNSNPALTENIEIADWYSLISPNNSWYCDGNMGSVPNGINTLTGSFNVSYNFQNNVSYRINIYEDIHAYEGQGNMTPYGYHACLPNEEWDNRLRYDETIMLGGAVCGNSIIEAGEQCDDGNTNNSDGCSSTCQNEAGPGPVPSADFMVQVTGINQLSGCPADVYTKDVCILQAYVTSNRAETKYVLFRSADGKLIGKGTNIVGSNDGVSELVLDNCLKGEENGDPKTYNITAVPYIVL